MEKRQRPLGGWLGDVFGLTFGATKVPVWGSRIAVTLVGAFALLCMSATPASAAVSSAPVVSEPANDAVKGSTMTVAFTGEASTYICSLDGVEEPCSSPKTYTGLSAGSHQLMVVSIHGLPPFSQWRGDETRLTFNVVAPRIAFGGGALPDEFINLLTRSWQVTSDPPAASYECKFGSNYQDASGPTGPTSVTTDPAPCDIPVEQGLPSEGIYSIEVRGIDEGGNVGEWARRDFVVDRTNPTISFLTAPPEGSVTDDKNPEFSFLANEPSSFSCSLNGSAYVPCNMPHPTGILAIGTYTVRATAVDKASNESEPIARTFNVVDRLPNLKDPANMGPDSDVLFPKKAGVRVSSKLKIIRGKASVGGLGGTITAVEVGVLKIRWARGRNGGWRERCSWMTSAGSFERGSCGMKKFHQAAIEQAGTGATFAFWLKRPLKRGSYQIYSRAHDSNGIHETHFSRRDFTRIPIRILR